MRYTGQQPDRERSVRLRSLPADIWVTNHARAGGRYRKFVAKQANDRVEPFIDREGYRLFIEAAEKELRKERVDCIRGGGVLP